LLREQLGVTRAIVAIGDNRARRNLADQLERSGFELVNAIHPSANIAQNAIVGRNVVAAAGVLVSAHAQVGDNAILNTGCIIDHETFIGPAVHVCPGAKLAGRVTVESGAFVGIGATVIQSVRVGHDAVIGAGAVVIHDVPSRTTVVGVPARPTKPITTRSKPRDWIMPEFTSIPEFQSALAGEMMDR